MMEPALSIRDAAAADEPAWRRLWEGYCKFYEVSIPAPVTARTWQLILDPAATIFGRVAVIDGAAVGFSVCVLHDGTWSATPVYYLEDLFVAPDRRGRGIGRRLIADAIDCAKAKGCSQLYWHTRADNPARKLYDEFASADDFVRYRLILD